MSGSPLTNDEQELRQRSYRFLMPAYDLTFFAGVLANLVRTRILPRDFLASDPAAYYDALLAPRFLSPSSRYHRLADDIYADRALLSPFRALGGEVLSADRVRGLAMTHVRDLNPAEREDAVTRMAENVGLIAWVREALAIRICQYRYALEHLAVAAPQEDAVPVERSLAALAQESRVLDRLDIGPLSGEKHAQTGPWVRPLPSCRAIVLAVPEVVAARPLVRKY